MTKTSQTILWVILAILIIGGIWWWSASQGQYASAPSDNSVASISQSAKSSASDTSDPAINQDMTSINAQMSAFASDSASVNQAMNDQPVAQSQF